MALEENLAVTIPGVLPQAGINRAVGSKLFAMPQSLSLVVIHVIFSTKDRRSVGETQLHYLWIQLFDSALNEKDRVAFVMANTIRNAHSCPMKTTEDARNYRRQKTLHAA
ncbi:MAG: hypothetical protein ACYDH9_18715 [Limisphaerales bacterium]